MCFNEAKKHLSAGLFSSLFRFLPLSQLSHTRLPCVLTADETTTTTTTVDAVRANTEEEEEENAKEKESEEEEYTDPADPSEPDPTALTSSSNNLDAGIISTCQEDLPDAESMSPLVLQRIAVEYQMVLAWHNSIQLPNACTRLF
jgi:hypothetical protein